MLFPLLQRSEDLDLERLQADRHRAYRPGAGAAALLVNRDRALGPGDAGPRVHRAGLVAVQGDQLGPVRIQREVDQREALETAAAGGVGQYQDLDIAEDAGKGDDAGRERRDSEVDTVPRDRPEVLPAVPERRLRGTDRGDLLHLHEERVVRIERVRFAEQCLADVLVAVAGAVQPLFGAVVENGNTEQRIQAGDGHRNLGI